MPGPFPLVRVAERLGVDLVAEQVQLYDGDAIMAADARAPWDRDLVSADPARPALIAGVTASTATAVLRFVIDAWETGAEMRLLDLDVDHAVPVVVSAGELAGYVGADRDGEDEGQFALWVAAGDPYRSVRSAATLGRIMARLRAPGGCPWDREQTTASQRDGVLDEAYEVVDAIDAGDDRNLAEELGDVLMTIGLQAQIAADAGRFTLADVYATINAKMVRRHPHVFGDVTVSGTDDIVANWQRIKADEKAAAGAVAPDASDPLDRYPASMPTTEVIRRLASRGDLPAPDTDGRTLTSPDAVADFVAWYANRLATGADPETGLRDALRRHLGS